jgi:putative oxidoreductase
LGLGLVALPGSFATCLDGKIRFPQSSKRLESTMATHGAPSTPRPISGLASWVDRAAVDAQDVLLLLARVALGAIFVQSGFGKLTDLAGFAAGLEGMGVPMPFVAGVIGACIEFLGGLALVLGAWTRLAAILVAGFTVVATLLAHRFWAVPPEEQMMQSIQFMKNLAIVGGLLAVVAAGAGRFSVDGFRRLSH